MVLEQHYIDEVSARPPIPHQLVTVSRKLERTRANAKGLLRAWDY